MHNIVYNNEMFADNKYLFLLVLMNKHAISYERYVVIDGFQFLFNQQENVMHTTIFKFAPTSIININSSFSGI